MKLHRSTLCFRIVTTILYIILWALSAFQSRLDLFQQQNPSRLQRFYFDIDPQSLLSLYQAVRHVRLIVST